MCQLQAGEGMEKVDLEDSKAKQKRGVHMYHKCARGDGRMCKRGWENVQEGMGECARGDGRMCLRWIASGVVYGQP